MYISFFWSKSAREVSNVAELVRTSIGLINPSSYFRLVT